LGDVVARFMPRDLNDPATRRANHPRGDRGQGLVRGHGLALLFVTAALAPTLLLQHLFPYPFLFLFFAAVMASAWFGGTIPGLFSVLLSTLLVDYFFVPPYYSFSINTTDGSYFGAFVTCSLVASWASSSMKKNGDALVAARDQLEIRVAERTTELHKSVRELRETERQLAHLSRFLTMGELTASIAHEISQPLTAVVTYGHACLEWLSAAPPNLPEARQAVERVIEDGTRAGSVLRSIRSHFKKEPPAKDWLDISQLLEGLIIFVRDEAARQHISIRTDFASALPMIQGDQVQLQQVALNLIKNGIEAMRGIERGPRELLIRSMKEGESSILVLVEDSGVGLSEEVAGKIFEPFFTSKPSGIGMGLPISRSIIEAHGGRLWAEPRAAGGAVFKFTIPVSRERK
jgi:signal transduction histidine kinase